MSSERRDFGFPGGKAFAFTVLDDTDVATVANVRPVYDHLYALGMRTTKTVWPLAYEGPSDFESSQTLEDPEYLDFVRELAARGFEITWHCASMESSLRERTETGLERFRELLGAYPRVHANHAYNRENVFWGRDRFDAAAIRFLYGAMELDRPHDHYQGHVEGSPWWWGDLCRKYFRYGRNLTFDRLDLSDINPSMPYRDPRRPCVDRWFSSADAPDAVAFHRLLRREEQERLERNGGFTIVATHFGKGFARDGVLDPATRRVLDELAARGGWFPTVSELLDHLAARSGDEGIPPAEWRSMQWRWARERVTAKLLRR